MRECVFSALGAKSFFRDRWMWKRARPLDRSLFKKFICLWLLLPATILNSIGIILASCYRHRCCCFCCCCCYCCRCLHYFGRFELLREREENRETESLYVCMCLKGFFCFPNELRTPMPTSKCIQDKTGGKAESKCDITKCFSFFCMELKRINTPKTNKIWIPYWTICFQWAPKYRRWLRWMSVLCNFRIFVIRSWRAMFVFAFAHNFAFNPSPNKHTHTNIFVTADLLFALPFHTSTPAYCLSASVVVFFLKSTMRMANTSNYPNIVYNLNINHT